MRYIGHGRAWPVPALMLVAGLVITACSAAPDSRSTPSGTQNPPRQTSPASPAPPADGEQSPDPPTADPAPTVSATEAADDGDGSAGSVAGTWSGTVTDSTGSQGITFRLREVGGAISGTAQWEHGRIHMGLRGMLEGNTLTLVHTPGTGDLTTTYEGTVQGNMFSGTVIDMFGDSPAPGGPGEFEVTREE